MGLSRLRPPPLPLLGAFLAAMVLLLVCVDGRGVHDFPLPLGALGPLGSPSSVVDHAAVESGERMAPSCEDARIKCAYRSGCGRALQNYIVGCSSLQYGPPSHCPESCQHALIALTSTDEGKDLMTCQCADELCEETKRRVEVCRPSVVGATRNESVVSCRVAQWICGADVQCSTALEYYHRYCRSMFHGRKCTHRCKNSISILRRQEKAAKLDTCRCDGREDYDCLAIRSNMARLCFHQEPTAPPDPLPGDVETNELLPSLRASGADRAAHVGSSILGLLGPLATLALALAASS